MFYLFQLAAENEELHSCTKNEQVNNEQGEEIRRLKSENAVLQKTIQGIPQFLNRFPFLCLLGKVGTSSSSETQIV